MAKLVIALCILLVACGAQGLDASTVKNWITSLVDSIREKIESVKAELDEAVEDFQSWVQTYIENISATVQDKIDAIEAEKEELLAENGDVQSCVFSSIDFKQTAQNIKDSAITCVTDSVSELRSKWEATYASINEFESVLNDIKLETDACGEVRLPLSCYLKVWRANAVDVAESGAAVLVAGGEAAAYTKNFKSTVESCAVESAVEVLQADAKVAMNEYKECVADAA